MLYREIFVSKKLIFRVCAFGIFFVLAFFVSGFFPAKNFTSPQKIIVEKGEGLGAVAGDLENRGVIRSALVFRILALGRDRLIKPGGYEISGREYPLMIIQKLIAGPETAKVVIPEGSSLFEIDDILSRARVLESGELIRYAKGRSLEGMLFPDTYEFPLHDAPESIVERMTKNFKEKTASILSGSPAEQNRALVIASLLEKEVVSAADRSLVAGIIERRLKASMPLQIDATICYVKREKVPLTEDFHCYPLSRLDFAADSPYNTYLHRGLPPGPIGSPGVDALRAALTPKNSPYWYYLSNPATGATIFSKTLDEQSSNKVRYLTP